MPYSSWSFSVSCRFSIFFRRSASRRQVSNASSYASLVTGSKQTMVTVSYTHLDVYKRQVGQHAHPLLDQFFFSFPENDMNLLIDCHICPMKGDTLLHIPLGSNHGVIAQGDQKMHYLWIDCTPEEQKLSLIHI